MDLMSIAAPAVEVVVGPDENWQQQTLTVRGLSLHSIASLLARFPNLLNLFQGRDLDLSMVLAVAPDAAAAIMASAAGHPDDFEAEQKCRTFGLQVQVELLAKIGELTFPAGFGPFVEKLTRLTGSLPGQSSTNGAAPDHGM